MFSGKKTYISVGGGILSLVALHFGYIDADTFLKLAGMFGFASLAAIRAGVAKGK